MPLTDHKTNNAVETGADLGTKHNSLIDALVTALAAKVATSGDETIAGVKTFSSSPIIPETPTTDTQAASKGYVDSAVAPFGFTEVSLSADSSKTISGLSSGGIYEFLFFMTPSTDLHVGIRVNADAGNNYWGTLLGGESSGFGRQYSAAVDRWRQTDTGYTPVASGEHFMGEYKIGPSPVSNNIQLITGQNSYETDYDTGQNHVANSFSGRYEGSAALSSITFIASTGTMTGKILYRKVL